MFFNKKMHIEFINSLLIKYLVIISMVISRLHAILLQSQKLKLREKDPHLEFLSNLNELYLFRFFDTREDLEKYDYRNMEIHRNILTYRNIRF